MPEHSVVKPHGIVVVTDVDGRTIERDTLRCVHCQKVWVVVPGSGRRRGFCTRCMGPTCGAAGCDACMNFEKKLELYEKGKIQKLH
jgi:hypothetical protein